uniref:Uncharacterized protein n=1 Tax=Solanum tuberosum TaxID=4113 RepID=M1DW63_SOLTU
MILVNDQLGIIDCEGHRGLSLRLGPTGLASRKPPWPVIKTTAREGLRGLMSEPDEFYLASTSLPTSCGVVHGS